MKHFPLTLAFICLLITPLGYALSLGGAETYLQRQQRAAVERSVVQNVDALLEGRWTVREEVQRNLSRYLSGHPLHRLGVRVRVIVNTYDGQVLYPIQFHQDMLDETAPAEAFSAGHESLDYMETAAENFRILNQGLDLLIDLDIGHTSLLANGMLLFWLLLSGGVLYGGARKTARDAAREESRRNRHIESLAAHLADAGSVIQAAREKEAQYRNRIYALSSERDGLSQDVEGLLEEMENLEEGVRCQQALREEAIQKMVSLEQEMDRLKNKLQAPKKAEKEIDRLRKRFRALYKNIVFTERSLEGMVSMTVDFQIKAEEILKALDEDPESVTVKRKVFGKGGKSHILEVPFSYSGRLYFHRNDDGVSVLAIGDKNTQNTDLAYLESYRKTQAD